MSWNELSRKCIQSFFTIFFVVIMGTALLNQDHDFTFREIMLCALFSLLGTLPMLVYRSNHELSKKEHLIRSLINFLLVELLILTAGNVSGQVHGPLQTLLFGLELLGIYIIVWIYNTWNDHHTASVINKQLKKYKEERNSK